VDKIDEERISEKRLILPKKRVQREQEDTRYEYRPEEIPDVVVPYRLPWEVS
jgi:hypothetical protein